jgi:WD40 repeat protein
VVRETSTLQILQLYNCLDTIQQIEFSNDSNLVLVASFKLATLQVFNVNDDQWTAQIEQGQIGLDLCLWAFDSRHILTFSKYDLRLTVWSLITSKAIHIQYPKHKKGFCFRPDGKYFCLAERVDQKEFISIFDTNDWTMKKRFGIETNDLEGVKWSPDGRYIIIWEPMVDYKMYVYHPDGRLEASYSAYDDQLGIKTVSWGPSAQLLAIGSFDEKVPPNLQV